MKTTIVPAQITTIEDRIAGSLGLSQLLLLSGPLFIGGGLYIVLPPTMHNAAYKLVAFILFALICGLLSIRIKGKILLLWLVVILRYNLRPRHYVYDKNNSTGRFDHNQYKPTEILPKEERLEVEHIRLNPLTTPDVVRLESILTNPASNLSFRTKRGGLHVLITEVKE